MRGCGGGELQRTDTGQVYVWGGDTFVQLYVRGRTWDAETHACIQKGARVALMDVCLEQREQGAAKGVNGNNPPFSHSPTLPHARALPPTLLQEVMYRVRP